MTFSPNGKKIVFGYENGDIKLWDIETEKVIQNFVGYLKNIKSLAFLDNGKSIVSVYVDSTIKLWDVNSGKELQNIQSKNPNYNRNPSSISSNGKIIITSDGFNLDIWDISRNIQKLYSYTEEVKNIRFYSDEIIQIFGRSNNQVFDAISSKTFKFLNYGNFDEYNYIDWSSNKKSVISLSKYGFIKLINLNNIDTLDNPNYIKEQISLWEKKLQVELNGTILNHKNISYNKPIWSKQHSFYWLEDAKNGDAKAMYELATIYDRNNENQIALEWYKKSAYTGYKLAEKRVVFLEEWMKSRFNIKN